MDSATIITLNLRRQRLTQDDHGCNAWVLDSTPQAIATKRLAVIICDMWDNHWSRGAVLREAALLPRMNAVVAGLRGQGTHIIHAPSETMDFYREHPARQRMVVVTPVAPPPDLPHDEVPLPVHAVGADSSDTGEAATYKAWSRQHPDLVIDATQDLISDNGPEIYSYLQEHAIEQVLIMGVHTNMCILNRSFAIKQMVRWGVNIALVRDLTDTMYNPAMPPYVNHDEGTQLVVDYIEKFWCPTIASEELVIG